MSIFGSILDKIFHHGQAATPATTVAANTGAQQQAAGTAGGQQQGAGTASGQQQAVGSSTAPASQQQASATNAAAPQSQPGSAGGPPASSTQPVDVEAVLNGMAARNPQKLNWRTSIVDLMKLLGLDSSLDARRALAAELHYSGDPNDSAAMNVWLHKAVMQKLADNGGKVPADLVRH